MEKTEERLHLIPRKKTNPNKGSNPAMTAYSELYDRRQKHSMYWFNKSSDLHAAAAALWYSRDESHSETIVRECGLGDGFIMRIAVMPVYYMLCGLSLELLYKAIIVAKGNTVKPSHRLVELAESAGIDLNPEHKGLLEMLRESIEWEGKYPVPTQKQAQHLEQMCSLIHKHLYDRESFGSLQVLKPNDALSWQSFDALWQEGGRVYWNYCRPDHAKDNSRY